MKNSLLLLFFCSLSILAFGQDKPVKDVTPPKPIIEEVPEEEIYEEVIEFESQSIDEDIPEYNSSYNVKFDRRNIFGDYELFYERSSPTYNKTAGILKKGEVLLPMIFKVNEYGVNGKHQIIFKLGAYSGLYNLDVEEWDIPFIYSHLDLLNKNIYLATKGSKTGVVDGTNQIIVDFNWKSIRRIHGLENYVIVENLSNKSLKGIYNILSKKMTVEPKYSTIEKLGSDNYFKVKTPENEYNIIDINGKSRFKDDYTRIMTNSSRSDLYVVTKGEKYGIIDNNEKIIVPIEYRSIAYSPYKDGSYLSQNKDGKYGCMLLDGTVTLPFVYDNLEASGGSYGSVAISKKGEKCGIIQINNGVPVEITTCDYDDIVNNQTVFIIEQNKKFAMMDLYGKMKTELVYDKIEALSKDLFIAKNKNQWSIMNSNGELLNSQPYSDLMIIENEKQSSYYSNYRNFSYLQAQGQNGKYGIIDKLGNEITPPTFDKIVHEKENIVLAQKNGKFGLFNLLTQSDLAAYEYDQITHTETGYYGFKGKDVYLISTRGRGQVTKL